jgi:hypothetical protein
MVRRGIVTMQQVATISNARQPSRDVQMVLPLIHSQVDHISVYLDGYDVPSRFLEPLRSEAEEPAAGRYTSARTVTRFKLFRPGADCGQ